MADYISRGITRIRDAYSTARICKLTHSEMHACLTNAIDTLPKRAPKSDRLFLRGYARALTDAAWADVEFCYRNSAGVIFSTEKQSTHRLTEEFYESGRGNLLADMEGAHLWRGTDKPFTNWSRIVGLTRNPETKQGG